MQGYKPEFVVREQMFSTTSHLDSNAYYNERGGSIKDLSTKLVYLLGSKYDNYPISTKAYGEMLNGKSTVKEVDDLRYKYPVMGRDYQATTVAVTNPVLTADALGASHGLFEVVFTSKWFKIYNIIESSRGVQARVMEEPKQEGKFWRYKLQLITNRPSVFCPATEVQAGTPWVDLYSAVSLERRLASDTNVVLPGSVQNQLGVFSKSISWGDKLNLDRVMDFTVTLDGQESKNWISWHMYQFEKAWLEECETKYWYSRYNRDANGEINLKELRTGEAITLGSGILEQIQNYSTYTNLTYSKLENLLSNTFFGMSDSANKVVTLYTGTGGMREIDTALRQRYGNLFGSANVVINTDKFLEGNGHNLGLTGFFDHAYFIDGYRLNVKHCSIFDKGRNALKSPKHPISGLPLESYRMVFIDDEAQDGQPNVQLLTLKGYSPYVHHITLGGTDAPKDLMVMNNISSVQSSSAPLRESGYNEGSYQRYCVGGVQILRANRCFNLECILGL